MIAFKVRWGRTYAARLDVDAAVRVRDLAGVDVMAAALDTDTRRRLGTVTTESAAELANVYYAIFQPVADREGISPRKFGKRLRAVPAGELLVQFFDELTAFFKMPGPERKPELVEDDEDDFDGVEDEDDQDDDEPAAEALEAADPAPVAEADDPPPTPDELWQHVYRFAGEAGVAPGPHTFGELAVMAEGRRRAEWRRTAALRADVINSAAYRKGPAVQPAELDPTGALKEAANRREQGAITPDNLVGVFRSVFKALGSG